MKVDNKFKKLQSDLLNQRKEELESKFAQTGSNECSILHELRSYGVANNINESFESVKKNSIEVEVRRSFEVRDSTKLRFSASPLNNSLLQQTSNANAIEPR